MSIPAKHRDAVWVVFRPLDVVTFRDGRPFAAGTATVARTTLPRPTTTGGALKAAFGREADGIAGPLLADVDGGRARLRFPVPADVVVDRRRTARRLHPDTPVAAPGLTVTCDLAHQETVSAGFRLPDGGGEPSPALLSERDMTRYLAGDPAPARAAVEERDAAEPLVRERRLGLARHARGAANGRTAISGFLYLAEYWRPRVDWEEHLGFACRAWFDGPTPVLTSGLVRLGGEARQAHVSVLPDATGSGRADGVALPAPPDDFPDGRALLYLATPAVFPGGWLPSGIDDAELVAAATTGPEPVGGWEPGTPGLSARGRPRPLRWAVGAGSVFFLRFADPATARAFAHTWHGRCLPQAVEWMRTVGFGMCLVGRW